MHTFLSTQNNGLNYLDELGDKNDAAEEGEDDGCPGYELVFTSCATDSLQIVAERFPWRCVKLTAAAASRNSHIIALGEGDDELQLIQAHSMDQHLCRGRGIIHVVLFVSVR
jgi:hypothetical protein